MPPKPKIDRPPYTPVTPVVDTMIGPRPQPLFGISSSPGGLSTPARTTKKTLIGGSV